jgi:hypothetical protein
MVTGKVEDALALLDKAAVQTDKGAAARATSKSFAIMSARQSSTCLCYRQKRHVVAGARRLQWLEGYQTAATPETRNNRTAVH